MASLDHLVVGARDLVEGMDAFERFSGLRVPTGGRHPLMGTHNCLTRLGDGAFLELIAIDPDATAPEHARWYSLDSAETQQLLQNGPTLLTWVVAVPDLNAALSAVRELGFDAGRAIEQRRDDLHWQISVRDDGCHLANGTFPTLIQWPEGVDAAARMPDLGARLVGRVCISHPEARRMASALALIGAEKLVEIVAGPMALSAQLQMEDRLLEIHSGQPITV